ncbi:MAG: Na+/H+ antiporter subunit E [Kineosporiaceae bacterium]
MRAAVRQLGRAVRLVRFSAWFAWLIVLASVEVAADALTPGSRLSPGILAYPLDSRSPAEVSAFTALVNLTPGTLTVAVRDGRPPTLYVHGMYAPDPAAFEAELRRLESRFLAACRLPEDRP